MATISMHNLKNGRKSYTIQVRYKGKFYSTTWKRPDVKKENDCRRELERMASEYERKVRADIDIKNDNITFKECSMQWLKLCESSNSKTYYIHNTNIVETLNEHFGNKLLKSITARDVTNFLIYLNEKEFTIRKAKLISSLDEIIKDYKIKDICENCNFTKTTFQFVRKGKVIELRIAEAICKFFHIDFKKYFEKIVITKNYELESKLKYKRTLSRIFNHAIENEYIDKNYASSVYTRGKLTGRLNEKDILSECENNKLIQALKEESNPKKQLAISILLNMGLRVSELSGLEWKDIDFDNHTMTIQRSTNFLPRIGEITKPTKTKSSVRTLDIPHRLFELLQSYKYTYDIERERLGNLWNDRDRIICQWNGLPTTTGTFSNWLTDILVKNGIRKVSPHSLRHTCITALLREKIPAQIVSKWAGHSTTTMTLNTYAHFLPEDKSACTEVLNKLFN